MYQDIVNNIEKLKDSYRYFDVEGDEDSIEFSADIPLPITVKGIPNGGKYSGMPYNRALDKYAKIITRAVNSERYTEKINDLLDIQYKEAIKAIKRQTKLPFPDFEHEEERITLINLLVSILIWYSQEAFWSEKARPKL